MGSQFPIGTSLNNMIRALLFVTFLAAGASAIPAMHCGDDEMMCWDSNTQTQSCQMMFYDSPNDPNVKCFNHCPASCSADEMACPSNTKDFNGCPMPDVCMGPLYGYHGQQCPRTQCDTSCPTDDQMPCDAGYDATGCPNPMVCQPMKVPGNMDPVTNTMTECYTDCTFYPSCLPNEDVCDMGFESDGCPKRKECKARSTQVWDPITNMNVDCPQGCDPVCQQGEQLCEGQRMPNGCPSPKECKPMSVMGNMDPITMTSFECVLSCDPTCSKDHQLCDMGFDTNGCPRPKECRNTKHTYWDSVTQTQMDCAFSCPTPCGTGDMYCPSTDENGCTGEGTCVMQSWESPKGNGNFCTGQCPMNCGPGMMECAGAMDENDCPMPSTCVAEGAVCP